VIKVNIDVNNLIPAVRIFHLHNIEICALLSSSKQTIKRESVFVNGFDKLKSISDNSFNIVP